MRSMKKCLVHCETVARQIRIPWAATVSIMNGKHCFDWAIALTCAYSEPLKFTTVTHKSRQCSRSAMLNQRSGLSGAKRATVNVKGWNYPVNKTLLQRRGGGVCSYLPILLYIRGEVSRGEGTGKKWDTASQWACTICISAKCSGGCERQSEWR